ncbi:alpha-2-macroglobulin family protein [Foetidibacter luteolus]|uniref:alpha-2-macroglobulin family protein n=1 Tax=Foetidibacter luteolus TaxID=2608880 RepID=UPI00129A1A3B|nr:alpha-2-macroglobulin family protein [Foetidibacter luteolus]
MRKAFLLLVSCLAFCLFVAAQTTDPDFTKQWIEIDTLIVQKDLPKSALKKVNSIYNIARQKKLAAQATKALLYKLALEDKTTEKNINQEVAYLQKEIETSFNVTHKSILQTLLAKTYQQYYNNNRWRFYNRNKTATYNKTDIETWNNDNLHQAITKNYADALQPATILQQTTLKPYNAIIIKGNTDSLRPTLYDLIAHEALDYFKSGDAYLTQPDYAFTLTDKTALGTAAEFMQYKFESRDTASHLLLALHLFQELMRFHSKHKEPSAFIDVNLERIEWVKQQASIDNEDELYIAALKDITGTYPDEPAAAQAWYLFINTYAAKAQQYKPLTDTANQYAYVTAKALIGQRLKAQPAPSEGNSNMQQLLDRITEKEITTQAENVNMPGQPFRLLVQYKNTDTFYARIINAALIDKAGLNRYDTAYWRQLARLKYIKAFSQQLPATGDYQQHAAEIKVDALPAGKYVLLGSTSKDFATAGRLTEQRFDVSSISYIKNGEDYFVLNRENGQPVEKATVKYINYYYDSKKGKSLTEEGRLETDKNGFFTLKNRLKHGNSNVQLKFYKNDDSLALENNEYFYSDSSSEDDEEDEDEDYEKDNARVHFFTDRSIYRPGQTVYFKGIVITKDRKTKQPKLLAWKDSIEVILNDANSQKIDSLELTLNEYGSFTGKFKLPENVLTGEFEMETEDFEGNLSFNVEEYKRPKFYVEFDTLKASYRLNDSIHITGHAKAYAGNSIGGAQVKFNVQREARFPYPWLFWRVPMPRSASQQIKNGTVTTDDDGKFEIAFAATPDSSIDKKTEPFFDFEIEASVTDISGETREKKTTVSLSYKSLFLQLNVPKVADAATFKNIFVTAQNTAGQDIPTDVKISISPLTTPTTFYRKRYWQQPDVFVMTEAEYHLNFPYDEYKAESDYQSWPKSDAVIAGNIHTDTSSKFGIPNPLQQGWYVVEATAKDKDGNEVKDVKYVQLYDMASEALPSPQANFQQVVNNNPLPGEQARLLTGTSLKDVFVIQQTLRKEAKPQYNYYSLNNGKKQLDFTATEKDRGGFAVYYAFVKHNRYYSNGMNVYVPFDNKELQVSYTTYRDKTEPGSNEKWSVQVSGNKGGKAAAELLTAMYDASLDQFKQQSWAVPDVWKTFENGNEFESNTCFTEVNSTSNETGIIYNDHFKSYSQLALNARQIYSNLRFSTYLQEGDMFVRGISSPRLHYRGGSDRAIHSLYFNGAEEENNAYKLATPAMAEVVITKLTTPQVVPDEQQKPENIQAAENNKPIQLRKNFNETAFFFPQLQADTAGNYSFSFTMPEALTQWKWLTLAHTKDLAFGLNQRSIVTQKTLMVQPNLPRFVREGDKMELTAKISNLSDSELTGQVHLQLVDAATQQLVDGLLQNVFPDQYFTASANGSAVVKFPVSIPFNFNKPLTIRISAKSKLPSSVGDGQGGEVSDGEENTLPVLTNRMLVTETLPLYVKGDTTRHFTFDKLLNNKSESLQTQSLTVEYTANPIWQAVQALPYLIEYPYECAEQTFNRFYANALAAYIVKQHPRIKQAFDQWRADSLSFGEGRGEVSNLEKNPELKQILLQETPWVLDAQNETQQRKNIALLFDAVKMGGSAKSSLLKLQEMQNEAGGFSWFKGGQEDRHITQYILTGIGKLAKLNAIPADCKSITDEIITAGLKNSDNAAAKEYDELVAHKADLTKNQLSYMMVQYAYMRSFYPKRAETIPARVAKFYLSQAQKFWAEQHSLYMRSMIALSLHRVFPLEPSTTGKFKNTPMEIIRSIKENAVETNDGAMYWKANTNGYYWHQGAIETQALLINAFDEIAHDAKAVSQMQTWLLLNKQTNNWKTTKATADACYALLSNNSLKADKKAVIQLGNIEIKHSATEAGSRYFKERIDGSKVTAGMANITVTTTSQPAGKAAATPSWGAVYWQYFEDLDKITAAASPLSLGKQLFVEKNTSKGKELLPVNANGELHVGDKITVRIILKSDRDMEYIHLKDMRASSMEPVNVLSGYKWQDGLGYYEATKDASTSFFIANLRKGTYVFDYPLYVTHTGSFSVGVATVQCMYAPEFSSHSEGIKVNVANEKQ